MLFVSAALLSGSNISAQAPLKKNVLILKVGLSHPLTSTVTLQIAAGIQDKPGRYVEFYSKSLDPMSFPDKPSRAGVKDWLVKKYGDYKLDAVVAVGPDAVNFLATDAQTMFLEVPIVICGSAGDQAGNPILDSRFTGTWMRRKPERTIEAALNLLPDTRRVAVVAGNSAFDKLVMPFTKRALSTFKTRADFTYLTDMGLLLKQLGNLPEHSVVFSLSFFEDSVGNRFVNATSALPMVAAAANAPVFGMSDTYWGKGIVGGNVMRFQEQGKITARIISELLDGEKAKDIPIESFPSANMFDWKTLQRWYIPENRIPPGSIVMFREPTLWERTKSLWPTWLLIMLGLSSLAAYLQHNRKQLALARERQMQLSGMLIYAGEKERKRIALELHDDFSQRLALLALGLENAADAISESPELAKAQLHELLNSASEIGADLHTLSHGLYSSTLESLGLVPAIRAFCKEVGAQHGLQVFFTSENIPNSVPADVALAIFRIVQEGLRNVMKHSRATKAEVVLRMIGNNLDVTVRDQGIGFDAKELNSKEGLGFRSMEERARLLSGCFEVHAEPGRGTKIEAWVPLQSEAGQHRAELNTTFSDSMLRVQIAQSKESL